MVISKYQINELNFLTEVAKYNTEKVFKDTQRNTNIVLNGERTLTDKLSRKRN